MTRARDAPKYGVLRDPAVRIARALEYREIVEAAEAEYASEQQQQLELSKGSQPESRKPAPDRVTPESADKPTSKIAKRREPAEHQELKQATSERSWLPRADMVQAISNVGMLATSIAVALNDIPGKWDAVAASGVAAVVANVAWANRRWKEKHGDRPEG